MFTMFTEGINQERRRVIFSDLYTTMGVESPPGGHEKHAGLRHFLHGLNVNWRLPPDFKPAFF